MKDNLEKSLEPELTATPTKINKRIIMGIRIKILRTLLLCAIIFGSLYFSIYKGTNYLYYNPLTKASYLIKEKNTTNDSDKDAYLLINSYFSLFYPGHAYFPYGEIKELGFGKYIIMGSVFSWLEPWSVGPHEQCDTYISRNTSFIESRLPLVRTMHEYSDPDDNNVTDDLLFASETKINEIMSLPESTILDVSLSFNNHYSLEQTINFIEQYPDSTFHWLATANNQSFMAEGFGIYDHIGYGLLETYDKEYPNLILMPDTLTPETLTNHYLSNLKILIDNPDFTKTLSYHREFDQGIPNLKTRYQEATKDGITTIGIRGNIPKKDLVTMINNGYSNFLINDAKFSILQK